MNIFKIVSLGLMSSLFVACATGPGSGGSSCAADDKFCSSVTTALDSTKACEASDSTCDAFRKAVTKPEACTGYNDNDGLCLDVIQAVGPNACFKDAKTCDSTKLALKTDTPCYSDKTCSSLRSAGFKKSTLDKLKK